MRKVFSIWDSLPSSGYTDNREKGSKGQRAAQSWTYQGCPDQVKAQIFVRIHQHLPLKRLYCPCIAVALQERKKGFSVSGLWYSKLCLTYQTFTFQKIDFLVVEILIFFWFKTQVLKCYLTILFCFENHALYTLQIFFALKFTPFNFCSTCRPCLALQYRLFTDLSCFKFQ